MSKSLNLLKLLEDSHPLKDSSSPANMSAVSNMLDLDGLKPGSMVTVDFTQDDPKSYEVVAIDKDDVIIKDVKTKKQYKVPLCKIAIEDNESPYVEDELDILYGVEGEDEDTGEVEKDPGGIKSQGGMDKVVGNKTDIKKRGVKLSILKKALDKSAKNRVIKNKNRGDAVTELKPSKESPTSKINNAIKKG